MHDNDSLAGWLSHLRCLLPPRGILHAGAGLGTTVARYAEWDVAKVLLVEADETRLERLGSALQGREDWSVQVALLSDREGETDFYIASNPNESGMLRPESLAGLWRNLKTREQYRLRTTTIESLLSISSSAAESYNWAMIDCLPALPVLRGASRYLEQWDVVLARVLLDESHLPGRGATKEELDSFLIPYGFRCATTEEERHPMVGSALYTRDWKLVSRVQQQRLLDERARQVDEARQRIEQLLTSQDEHAELARERLIQLQQAIRDRDQQAELAAERQREIQGLVSAHDEQATRLQELDIQAGRAARALDEQAKLAAERQQEIERLAASRDEEMGVAGELNIRIEHLLKSLEEQSRFALECQQKVEQAASARDEQARLADERQKEIEKLARTLEEQAALSVDRQREMERLSRDLDEQARLATERQSLIDTLTSGGMRQVGEIAELLKLQQSQLNKMDEGIKTHIKRNLENSTRQIESFISIESYLNRGRLMPAFHGWPVSADLALHLIGLIESNKYDLIVEFGSGTSTILFASAISRKLQQVPVLQLNYEEQMGVDSKNEEVRIPEGRGPLSSAVSEISRLPKIKILSFEHNREYFDQANKKLSDAGLNGFVELIYAPLREYLFPDGERLLFYTCEEQLAAVANGLNGKRTNILILVDGPPGSTGKHARYPALPIVLQYLGIHQLHVLLDDYCRPDEQEIVERWVELLKKRSLVYQKKELPFEKGACLLSIK